MADVATEQRLYRLVGEERGTADGEHGGGVEVVTLFTMLLEMALDNTSVVLDDAAARVRERYAYKESRLRVLYPEGDQFLGFTTDGLDQLVAVELLQPVRSGARTWWELTEKVKVGSPLTAVSGRGRRKVSVTVYPAEVRVQRDAVAQQRMNAATEAAKLRRHGPGLRPLDRGHVDRLAEGMRSPQGFLDHHPVLVDQHDRVLDGRHRLAAARLAGVTAREKSVVTESDAHAVTLAVMANIALGWRASDLRSMVGVLDAIGASKERQEATRRWVVLELEQDPGRSNRLIAELVGCDERTVRRVRDALPPTAAPPQSPKVVGRDNRVTTPHRRSKVPDAALNSVLGSPKGAATATSTASAQSPTVAATPAAVSVGPAQPRSQPAVTAVPAQAKQDPTPDPDPPVVRVVVTGSDMARVADQLITQLADYPDVLAALVGHLVIGAERRGVEWRRQA